MFKFLFKLLIFIGLVTVALFIASKRNLLPSQLSQYFDTSKISLLSKPELANLVPQVSSALDSLITHPNQDSPVVLGLKVTNDSLNTIVDLIQRLSPEQKDQLKSALCTPASPSASPSASP